MNFIESLISAEDQYDPNAIPYTFRRTGTQGRKKIVVFATSAEAAWRALEEKTDENEENGWYIAHI
ncbi:MAG: hypothetical protein PHY29_02755 [Syntrophales bacterium]|nr:hypothetical protein [Syntrophales bacterium]